MPTLTQRMVRWIGLMFFSVSLLYAIIAHFSSFFTGFFVDHPKDRALIHLFYVSVVLFCFVEVANREEDKLVTALSIFKSFRSFYLMVAILLYLLVLLVTHAALIKGIAREVSGLYYLYDTKNRRIQEIDEPTYIFQKAAYFRLGSGYWIWTSYLALLTITSLKTISAARDKPTESV
jgi:O-antigen/teichoic acid export membrane protein